MNIITKINQEIEKIEDKIDELYYHRVILFSVICNQNKECAWKSWKHDDGTMFKDYFMVVVTNSHRLLVYKCHFYYQNLISLKRITVSVTVKSKNCYYRFCRLACSNQLNLFPL